VKLVATTSAQRIPYLKDNTVDLVREHHDHELCAVVDVNFSTQYYDAGQKILVPRPKATGIADPAAKRCAAVREHVDPRTSPNARPNHPVSVQRLDRLPGAAAEGTGGRGSPPTDTILAGLAKQDPTTKVSGNGAPRSRTGWL